MARISASCGLDLNGWTPCVLFAKGRTALLRHDPSEECSGGHD
jgi:hypothetical protein